MLVLLSSSWWRPLATVDLGVDLPASASSRSASGQAGVRHVKPDLSVAVGET